MKLTFLISFLTSFIRSFILLIQGDFQFISFLAFSWADFSIAQFLEIRDPYVFNVQNRNVAKVLKSMRIY